MAIVYIGIGTNLGRRQDNCETAIKLLEVNGIHVTSQSKMYETSPWGIEDQPDFVNMAVCAETRLEPMQLLTALKGIEREMGRQAQEVRFGPRIIDLDILLYDGLAVDLGDELKIPHPQLHERGFVLMPLNEIARNVLHPVLNKTIGELMDALED